MQTLLTEVLYLHEGLNSLKGYKGQSLGFTSSSTARVTLGQVLGIASCRSQTHTDVIACDYLPNLLGH